ncbi:uncharacterized protein BO72DRAFT_444073 [Aspergillus fijiensis CBS 313.89]|uniref:Uncharacterized protein n=1 Tax=Aspergillus fijiensis CBS 313.89 TaxID=1448319 RepID=A0A8G1S2B2_9EURO|nr:uncharacterized protein BO72DRAFT_444073 [Aspergillus fijiensis CBS 313.89]RAK82105.1 hypothetical protein BO72DRAFT_444073 [Aspergillus fijiensis CBS 313.89]
MATVTTTTHTSHKTSNKPRDTTYISNIPTPTGGFARMEIAQDVPPHPDYYPRERQDIALTFRGFVDPDIKSDVIPDYYPGMFDNDPYARIVAPAPPKRVDSLVAPPADLPEYLKAYHDKLPATPDAPAVQYNRGTRHRDASIYVPEEDELV